jgi:hypothetical protein
MAPATSPMPAARNEISTSRNCAVASGGCWAAVLMPVTESWGWAPAPGELVISGIGWLLSVMECDYLEFRSLAFLSGIARFLDVM